MIKTETGAELWPFFTRESTIITKLLGWETKELLDGGNSTGPPSREVKRRKITDYETDFYQYESVGIVDFSARFPYHQGDIA